MRYSAIESEKGTGQWRLATTTDDVTTGHCVTYVLPNVFGTQAEVSDLVRTLNNSRSQAFVTTVND